MISGDRLRWRKLRECDGAAMVEFSIMCTLLIVLVFGIIEFGFLWYQKQVITNASREGARYGVTYATNTTGTRKAPKNLSPSIVTMVNNYCTNRIPTGSWTTAVSGTGFTASDGTDVKGFPLIVQVTCQNQMDILSGFIPSLANITFTAQTVMNCE
jgi:Flp pilus assembly protein TadG